MLIRISALIACLFSFSSYGLGQVAAPENDFQVWSETTFSKPLTLSADGKTEQWSLNFGTTLRMFDDGTRPADRRLSIGIGRKINPYLSVSGTYMFRSSNQVAGPSEIEHRLKLDGNLTFKLEGFSIQSRSRAEKLIRVDKSDKTRLRQRIRLSHPIRSGGEEVFSPFASAEVFYDWTAGRLSRDEFMLGLTRRISSHFSIEPYVGLRRNRATTFRNVGILGFNLKIKIPK
jgi:hypothetical protein